MRRSELATHCRRVQTFEDLQGRLFWFGGMAGGAVMVTTTH